MTIASRVVKRAHFTIRALACLYLLGGCGGEQDELAANASSGNDDPKDDPILDPANACALSDQVRPDGSCKPAGVATCGHGFVSDGRGGCDAVRPSALCRPGTMALPGETGCRPVAACGAARYPQITTAGAVHHVDGAYQGTGSDGSAAKPWTLIQGAIDAADDGDGVAIAAGVYRESVYIIRKSLSIAGRCPELVRVVGGTWGLAIGSASPGLGETAGTSVAGLSITAQNIGVIASDTPDLLLERLWIHDAGGDGVLMGEPWGPTSFTLIHSLVERNGGAGVNAFAVDAEISESVIRHNHPGAGGDGRGISIERSASTPATATISRCVVEGNATVGIISHGADVTISDCLVRGTMPDLAGIGGRGVVYQGHEGAADRPGTGSVHRTVIEDNHDLGFAIIGSEVVARDVVVRTTREVPDIYASGIGMQVQLDPANMAPAKATITDSLFENNHLTGVSAISATLSLEGCVVRDTHPRSSDGFHGTGVTAVYDYSAEPGVFPPSQLSLRHTHISGSSVGGITIAGSQAKLTFVEVDNTAAALGHGFGDGLVIIGGYAKASVTISQSRFAHSARAGIANFGASVSVSDSLLSCNKIQLDGELFETAFDFQDGGGNNCRCEATSKVCTVLSSNLQPPSLPSSEPEL